MFQLASSGLSNWAVGDTQLTHPDCHFGPYEKYGGWFRDFIGQVEPGVFLGGKVYENSVEQNFSNMLVHQTWTEPTKDTLRGVISVTARQTGTIVWGFSRLHVVIPSAVDEYPSSRLNQGGQFQSFSLWNFFPSQALRVGGCAWLQSVSGKGIFVRIDSAAGQRRHLFYWEPYGDGRYALHIIFYWPLRARQKVSFTVDLSWTSSPQFTPIQQIYSSTSKPIIQCLRAMSAYQSESNPHGFVNVDLSDQEAALNWIRPLAEKASKIKALGIIGWPWGYPKYLKQPMGGHLYPYNGWAVEEPLASSIEAMRDLWVSSGAGSFGTLYRPYYYARELGKTEFRLPDETGMRQMVADLRGCDSLLQFDDFGVDSFFGSSPVANGEVAVQLLRNARQRLGRQGQWFVEHASSWTLPLAGGFFMVSKRGGALEPDISPWQWKVLRQMFPGANWMASLPEGFRFWGDDVRCQRDLVEFATDIKVSPLIQDWLLDDYLVNFLSKTGR